MKNILKYILIFLILFGFTTISRSQIVLTYNQFEDSIVSQLYGASIQKLIDTNTGATIFFINDFKSDSSNWNILIKFPFEYDTQSYFLMFRKGSKNDFYNMESILKRKYGNPNMEKIDTNVSFYWDLNNGFRHYLDYFYDPDKQEHYIVNSIFRKF